MRRLRVALLSGGVSPEREVSLSSGRQVRDALDASRYDVVCYDPKYDIPRLVAEAGWIDAALVILHGPYGEDGRIQGLLDLLGVPYQGTGVLGSAIGMNKLTSKRLYELAGLPVPPYASLDRSQTERASALAGGLGYPLVVKPCEGGSSIGTTLVREPSQLASAVELALSVDDGALLEAYIAGTEIAAGVLGNKTLEPLPLVEIVPGEEFAFFEYEAKYVPGASQEICPARISPALTDRAMAAAITAHQALFCRGCSRTDMILSGETFYVLETNTIPGMTPNSLLPLAARTAGMEFSQLLDRLIELALEAQAEALKPGTE